MKDRSVQFPGRMKITDATTEDVSYAFIERAEGTVTEAGTPYNVASVLTDATATALGLTSTATPNDAYSAIATRLDTADQNVADALDNEAAEFDSTAAYTTGDYVIYEGDLYKFTADHAAGDWTGSDATQVTIGAELVSIKGTVDSLDAEDVAYDDAETYTAGTVGAEVTAIKEDISEIPTGTYPDMTVGGLLGGDITSQVPYTSRSSGGDIDAFKLEYLDSVVGGTIAWNQLVDTADTSITVVSGHKYISYISDAWNIGTSDGTSIVVDGSSGDMVFDLTQMYGTTIANAMYALGSTDCVAWFRSLYPETSYAYNAGELMSVQTSAHVTKDANNTVLGTYALDSSLTLRGLPKLDASNNLYYDGDSYAYDGTVTRKYGIVDLGTKNWTKSLLASGYRFGAGVTGIKTIGATVVPTLICSKYFKPITNASSYAGSDTGIAISHNSSEIYISGSEYNSMDVDAFKTAMSGVYLVYELATQTTETADAYTQTQLVDANGTEEFTDARTVPVPVGNITRYPQNMADMIMVPPAPSTDGTYTLQLVVSGGEATAIWT